MATFVANAIDHAHNGGVDGQRPPEAGSDPVFGDVSAGNAHVENINRLAAQDIVTGTGDGDYSPTVAVSRAQKATFAMQGADYLDEIAHWLPTFEAESGSFEVTMSWINEVSDDGAFGQGDEPATGQADVTLTTEPGGLGTVQVDFTAQDLSSAPTMVGETGPLHVHEGELVENGPIVDPTPRRGPGPFQHRRGPGPRRGAGPRPLGRGGTIGRAGRPSRCPT